MKRSEEIIAEHNLTCIWNLPTPIGRTPRKTKKTMRGCKPTLEAGFSVSTQNLHMGQTPIPLGPPKQEQEGSCSHGPGTK